MKVIKSLRLPIRSLAVALCFVVMFVSILFMTDVSAATYTSRAVTFNYADGTVYDQAKFDTDFGNHILYPSDAPELKIYSNRLRIKLPANVESKGIVATAAVPDKDDYYNRAKIYFPSDFVFGNSDIKLPGGIGGGTCPSGGSTDKDNGWSVRSMRSGVTGHLVMYTYDTHRGQWGSSYDTGVTLSPGQTYDVIIYVKRNTAGAQNGILKVWVNDTVTPKIDLTLKFSNNQVDADTMIFDCFRGGGGEPPAVDTYVHCDEFQWYETPPTSSTNVALNKPAVASSSDSTSRTPDKAVDGNSATRWGGQQGIDNSWIYVDLGATYNITRVKLNWEVAYGKSYKIQVSTNTSTWTDIYSTTTGDGGIDDLTGLSGSGRYVRMQGVKRGTGAGYSLWDFEVYN